MAMDWLLLALYLPFLAFALDVPVLRGLKRVPAEGAVVALAPAGGGSGLVRPS